MIALKNKSNINWLYIIFAVQFCLWIVLAILYYRNVFIVHELQRNEQHEELTDFQKVKHKMLLKQHGLDHTLSVIKIDENGQWFKRNGQWCKFQ